MYFDAQSWLALFSVDCWYYPREEHRPKSNVELKRQKRSKCLSFSRWNYFKFFSVPLWFRLDPSNCAWFWQSVPMNAYYRPYSPYNVTRPENTAVFCISAFSRSSNTIYNQASSDCNSQVSSFIYIDLFISEDRYYLLIIQKCGSLS